MQLTKDLDFLIFQTHDQYVLPRNRDRHLDTMFRDTPMSRADLPDRATLRAAQHDPRPQRGRLRRFADPTIHSALEPVGLVVIAEPMAQPLASAGLGRHAPDDGTGPEPVTTT